MPKKKAETKELATVEENAMMELPAEWRSGKGAEHVDVTKLKKPFLAIVQPTSKKYKELANGTLVNSISGVPLAELGEEVEIIPIMAKSGRNYFVKNASGDWVLKCKSSNGKQGSGEPGGNCKTCPHGEMMWRTYRQTGKAPECGETINFLFLVGPDRTPMFYTFKSTSFKEGSNFLSTLSTVGPGGVDYYAQVYSMRVVEDDTYYNAKIRFVRFLKPQKEKMLYLKGAELHEKFLDADLGDDPGDYEDKGLNTEAETVADPIPGEVVEVVDSNEDIPF